MKTSKRLPLAAAVVILASVASAAPATAARPSSPAAGPTRTKAVTRPFDGQLLFRRFDPAISDDVPITVNPDGSHQRQVYPGGMECAHWSPDGTRIASCGTLPNGDGGTIILTVDTGAVRYRPFLPIAGLFSPCYVWSPDATRLACEASSDTNPGLNGIYTVRIRDWGDVRRVTSNPGGGDVPGSYSPDGRRMTFVRYDDQGAPVGLFVVSLNGTAPRRITPAGSDVSTAGAWSPDGNLIAFSRHLSPLNRQTIWVVHANGQGLRQIPISIAPACGGLGTDPTSLGCSQPVWSPSGRRLAFLVNSINGSRLFTSDDEGRHVRHVADNVDDSADWGVHPLAG